MKHKKILLAGLALLALGVIASPLYVEAAGNAIKGKMNKTGEKFNQRFKNHPEKASTTPEQFKEMRVEHQAKSKEINQALANGDYNAWLALVGEDSPIAEKITADNFFKVSQAYNLMQEARNILDEIGLKGQGIGMMNGFGPHAGGFGGGPVIPPTE